jgi:deoxycytidylate deaminase
MINFKRLLEITYSLVDYSQNKRCHHFSFILTKGKIVSIGENVAKTHTKNLKNPSVSRINGMNYSNQKHTCSEFLAMTKLKNKTNILAKKCTMVNIRLGKNGQICNSRPCISCQSLLQYFDLRDIYYSTDLGTFEKF